MRVVYLLSSSGNPLYGGQYELNSRYQTYGQHSFIYDLVEPPPGVGFWLTYSSMAGMPFR